MIEGINANICSNMYISMWSIKWSVIYIIMCDVIVFTTTTEKSPYGCLKVASHTSYVIRHVKMCRQVAKLLPTMKHLPPTKVHL